MEMEKEKIPFVVKWYALDMYDKRWMDSGLIGNV